MMFPSLLLFFGFACLWASRIEVERPLPEDGADVMMEHPVVLKRVRPGYLQVGQEARKRPKVTFCFLGATTEDLVSAINQSDCDLLTSLLSRVRTVNPIKFDKLLVLAMTTQEWECAVILLKYSTFFSKECLKMAYLRSIQMRQFGLVDQLLEFNEVISSKQMLKEGFLILIQLLCTPTTTHLANRSQSIVLLIKKICEACKFNYLPVLSQIKYVRRSGLHRDLDAKIISLELTPRFAEVAPPSNYANICFYLQNKFTNDQQKLEWLTSHYGNDKLYKQVFFYLPRSMVRNSFMHISDAIPFMSERSKAFYTEVIREAPFIKGSISTAERFWANCLFDSYFHLIDSASFYEGSVVLDEDGTPSTRLFPHYASLFLEHFIHTKRRMTIDADELDKVKRLQNLLENVVESSKRYGSSTAKLNVMHLLKRMKVGEEYGLDIYALDKPKNKQGHLVVGIVSKAQVAADDLEEGQINDTFYNIRIVNTGTKSFDACGLNRQLICVDQFGIPKKEFMAKYLHIINGASYTDIYMRQYIPEAGLYDLDLHNYQESDVPLMTPSCYSYEETIRGQRSGTCSVRRLWSLAKLILGLELYMEFKTHFIISFLEYLAENFNRVVSEDWSSPRPSVWSLLINSPLFERNLLKQLERLDEMSPRYHSLRRTILESVADRFGTDNIDTL